MVINKSILAMSNFPPSHDEIVWGSHTLLENIRKNGGIENLTFKTQPPIYILRYLIGEKTKVLHIPFMSEEIFETFPKLNMKNVYMFNYGHTTVYCENLPDDYPIWKLWYGI